MKKLENLIDKEHQHSAQRSSELTLDYITYLEDYAKLNDIDIPDFLLHNFIAFPSTMLAHLSLHHNFHLSFEQYIHYLIQSYNLLDGENHHHPLLNLLKEDNHGKDH